MTAFDVDYTSSLKQFTRYLAYTFIYRSSILSHLIGIPIDGCAMGICEGGILICIQAAIEFRVYIHLFGTNQ